VSGLDALSMLPVRLKRLVTEPLPSHVVAYEYLSALPRATRRDEGKVYTPSSLVTFILDLSAYTDDVPIEKLTVLDPACGAGAFLIHAFDRLAARLARLGYDPKTAVGREELRASAERCLFGMDKDPVACELAREVLRSRFLATTGLEAAGGFLASNIVTGDFLLAEPGALPLERFDLVVGNPPYVATTRLSPEQKQVLRSRFIVANGRPDLYTMFFERGLRLLGTNGKLAFITPNKFLVSESSKRLIKLILSSASVNTIASFRSHRVFEGAATVPCVTVLQRCAGAARFKHLECSVAPGGRGPVAVTMQASAEHPKAGEQPWLLADPELLSLAHLIQDKHPVLGQLATRISAGIATGRDRIFVLRGAEGQDLEPELRRPAVRGQDLSAFRIDAQDLEIILPYLPTSDGRPALVDLDDFPKTKAYLEVHREELATRHCVRAWQKPWYDIHDPWTLDITGMTKVLVPDVACTNRFVIDDGTFCPLHSAYYIIPKGVEPMFLTAVLSSSPVEFLVRLAAPVVKDGFSRYRRQFLITLPIPEADTHVQSEIVGAVEVNDLSKADELCCRLFGLTRKHLKTVRGFLERVQSVHGTPSTPRTVGTTQPCPKTQSCGRSSESRSLRRILSS